MEDKYLDVAKQAAIKAGELIRSYIGKKHTEKIKRNSSDFATEADLEAEHIILDILTKNFPTHNIISEEKGVENKLSDYTWVIDPLDGTVAFSTAMPIFSVSIALLYKNQPIIGAVNHVSLNNLYWAKKSEGAFVDGQRIYVSTVSDLEHAVLNFDSGHLDTRREKLERYLYPLMEKVRYVYSLGGGVMSAVLVAKGVLDGAPNSAYIWDFAAAGIILEEAGGRVTDLDGNEPDWSKTKLDLVASNGLIHQQILEALKG